MEPPEQIKKYYDLFAQMTSTVDEDERVKFGQEIFDGLAETPLGIGLILEVPGAPGLQQEHAQPAEGEVRYGLGYLRQFDVSP